MRWLAGCIVLCGCVALAPPAIARPPQPGTYRSTDLGGTLLPGRDLEGWAPGASLLSGVTVNLYSWVDPSDGPPSHGSEWLARCMGQQGSAVLLSDDVDGDGNGQRVYQRFFEVSSSFLSLDPNGPWGGGEPPTGFQGEFDAFSDRVTVRYVNGDAVATTSSAHGVGHFYSYPGYTLTLEIAQGNLVASGVLPGVYGWFPAGFYLPGCVPSAPAGAWWEVRGVTITIEGPPVATRGDSWGRLRTLYR